MRVLVVALFVAGCDRGAAAPPSDPEPAPRPVARAPDGLDPTPLPDQEPAESAPAEERGRGPYDGDYFDGERPQVLAKTQFVESPPGKPRKIGCADGQREGFADVTRFPDVAGCLAAWDSVRSLRAPATGNGCGDDAGPCTAPADACASGWHVCGSNGSAVDMTSRLTAKECSSSAGPGRFNAAMSHSPNEDIDPCPTITPATRLPCVQAGLGSEAVCCGADCLFAKCKDGVWPGKTRISRGTSEGCGAVTSDHNGGVLCCKD